MAPSDSRLPKTSAAINRGMEQGLHIGAQVYVSLRGEVIADRVFGESRLGVAMTTDTLMLWLSAGKPVSAVAIAQLGERGLLDLDDPVARHIPEFSQGNKEAITIRHILTHTAGFRAVLGHWEDQPWDQVIASLCAARIEPRWVPGETAGYHPLTSWYILGEIVHRLDGRPFDRYVREAIFTPAGMTDCWIGLPSERYRAYGNRIGLMHDTRAGSAEANYPHDAERIAAQCRPPSGARGPIRQLGFFYEMLLNHGTRGKARLLLPKTVELITAPHRIGVYDKTFRHIIDWGLGFIVQSDQYGVDTVPYGYGPHASPRTFGHGGSRSSTGYADPEHGLVVACVFNGAPDEAKHDDRMREVNEAIYEDLDLA